MCLQRGTKLLLCWPVLNTSATSKLWLRAKRFWSAKPFAPSEDIWVERLGKLLLFFWPSAKRFLHTSCLRSKCKLVSICCETEVTPKEKRIGQNHVYTLLIWHLRKPQNNKQFSLSSPSTYGTSQLSKVYHRFQPTPNLKFLGMLTFQKVPNHISGDSQNPKKLNSRF